MPRALPDYDRYHIRCGDALAVLRQMAGGVVHTCVTSPPYYGLRDYGTEGQIGLESTPAEYVDRLVEVFREVRRVLRADGTLWLNLGDSYSGARGGAQGKNGQCADRSAAAANVRVRNRALVGSGLKSKDLIGIPWEIAFALRADGWYLRSDVIWAKPNAMPESVGDRPTRAHEYLFLLSKSEIYSYDADAIKEPLSEATAARYAYAFGGAKNEAQRAADQDLYANRTRTIGMREPPAKRNKRSIWTVATQPYKGAHFAVMPEGLVEPCVLAGSPEDGLVLDPFCGSGTVGAVALRLGRHFVGVEINPKYIELAHDRIVATIGERQVRAAKEVG